MDGVTPNQSYLMKWMQWHIAAAITVLMQDQNADVPTSWHAMDKPETTLYWPTDWRVNHQRFNTRSVRGAANHCYVEFKNPRWDSQYSSLDYGTKSIDHAVDERDDSKTKIIHNDTDAQIHVAYEEAVELTNSFSSSITKGVTLDVTKDASVDASLTVKGEYAGVGAEATVASHFGVSQSKQSTSEEGREKSEEGTRSESLAIEFDADPRSYYLVEVKKENERSSQPFDIDGVMDFGIRMIYYGRAGRIGHHGIGDMWSQEFASVAAFEQWVRGYDTNHPDMEGYWEKAPEHVKAAVAYVMNPENRRIQVSGINQASLDSNATYDVDLLGDHVPSAVAHLPVVAAADA